MTGHHISTPSSPSTRQRSPGSQLEQWSWREGTTLWRRLKMSPSSVLDDEDNMNRNISPRNNVVVILWWINIYPTFLSSLLHIAVFSYYCKYFRSWEELQLCIKAGRTLRGFIVYLSTAFLLKHLWVPPESLRHYVLSGNGNKNTH